MGVIYEGGPVGVICEGGPVGVICKSLALSLYTVCSESYEMWFP